MDLSTFNLILYSEVTEIIVLITVLKVYNNFDTGVPSK